MHKSRLANNWPRRHNWKRENPDVWMVREEAQKAEWVRLEEQTHEGIGGSECVRGGGCH